MASIASTTYQLLHLESIAAVVPRLPIPPVNFSSFLSESFGKIASNIVYIGNITGVARIIADVVYIYKLDFLKEETPFGMISGLVCCVSDFASILPFLGHWKVIDLGKIAGVVGQNRFLAPLMTLPISTVLSVVTSVGYLFFGIDAVYRLLQPETKGAHKRQAWLDVANCITQIAMSGLIIAGVQRIPVLIPMGGICLVMGSVCFLHRCMLPPKPGTKKRTEEDLPEKAVQTVKRKQEISLNNQTRTINRLVEATA